MKTFISYAQDCRKEASEIKTHLDQFGFNCFLAHEDIPPQTKWPDEIQNALEKSVLFLPLLTTKFIESFYCQQETGFAYCKGIEILPVIISKAPMGMIASVQAIKFNVDKFKESCCKIVSHIAKNRKLKEPVLDALIEWFGKSNNYESSTERAKILNEFDFSPSQVKAIEKHIRNNRQIYNNKYARDPIYAFMKKYEDFLGGDFRSWYNSEKASRIHMRS